jgi:hypothetical protein
MDNATKIQAVINTLALLEIPASYSNVDRMIGIYKTLAEVRDSLAAPDEPKEEAEDEGQDRAE